MKKFQILAAVAACVFWAACSNDTSNPGSADGDVSSVEKTDGATAQFAKQSGSDVAEEEGVVAETPDAVDETDEPAVEPESSASVESSASLDSILAILFPTALISIRHVTIRIAWVSGISMIPEARMRIPTLLTAK